MAMAIVAPDTILIAEMITNDYISELHLRGMQIHITQDPK
jgi:hypothetical protein